MVIVDVELSRSFVVRFSLFLVFVLLYNLQASMMTLSGWERINAVFKMNWFVYMLIPGILLTISTNYCPTPTHFLRYYSIFLIFWHNHCCIKIFCKARKKVSTHMFDMSIWLHIKFLFYTHILYSYFIEILCWFAHMCSVYVREKEKKSKAE